MLYAQYFFDFWKFANFRSGIPVKILNSYCVICTGRTSPLNAYFSLDTAILLYFKQKNFSGGWINLLIKKISFYLIDSAKFLQRLKSTGFPQFPGKKTKRRAFADKSPFNAADSPSGSAAGVGFNLFANNRFFNIFVGTLRTDAALEHRCPAAGRESLDANRRT